MVLMRVDLPQPLGPRMATCSPLAICREISCRTIFSPRATEACSRWTKLPRSEGMAKSLKLTETGAVVTCDLGRYISPPMYLGPNPKHVVPSAAGVGPRRAAFCAAGVQARDLLFQRQDSRPYSAILTLRSVLDR